jgi:hypothetical protein
MAELYYGTVTADGMGKMFEGRYDSEKKALRELRREARRIVSNSFEENLTSYWDLYLGDKAIASGQVPMKGLRRIWKNYPGTGWHDYGYMVIGGTRIC